jgi:hypothetical protein
MAPRSPLDTRTPPRQRNAVIRRPAPLAVALLLLAPFADGCSSEPPKAHIVITVGQEADAFSQDPKVVSVLVEAFAPDGSLMTTATAAPGGSLSFGEIADDAQLAFEVTGLDAQGNTQVRGRSLGAIAISSLTGPLPVFAQRVNQWARPPGIFTQTHAGGVAAVGAERYLLLGGGTVDKDARGDEVEIYDLLGLGALSVTNLVRVPETMVPRGAAVLMIDHTGATSINLGSGDITDVATPTGLTSYALVAGGKPVDASDGRTFVVGGTRTTDPTPTKSVLIAGADGTLSSLSLVHERAGASALWVEGVGLVVVGGSAVGSGIEVLGPTATSFAAIDLFPADDTVGAGAVIDGLHSVVLVGGAHADGTPAAVRRLDPTCTKDCDPVVIDGSTPSLALTSVHAYTLGGGRIFAVGEELTVPSQTRTFVLQLGMSATELPLREPRRGATVSPAPNGTLAVLGGRHVADDTPALSVELLFPQ